MADEKKHLSRAEELELEMKELQLEDLKNRLETERQRKAIRADQARRQEETQRAYELSIKQRQAVCNHRKGGLNVEGLTSGRGADALFCVNRQTVPDGTTYVLCTRCGKEWWPKDKEYAEAMNWPTDNIPSQSVTFTVHA